MSRTYCSELVLTVFVPHSISSHAMKTKNTLGFPVDASIVSRNPIENADSYALFANWAWIHLQQKRKCPHNFPLWNTPATVAQKDAASLTKAELRHLLAVPEDVSDDSFGSAADDVQACDATCAATLSGSGGGNSSASPFRDDGSIPIHCSGRCSGELDSDSCGEGCQCAVTGKVDPGNGAAVSQQYSCIDN